MYDIVNYRSKEKKSDEPMIEVSIPYFEITNNVIGLWGQKKPNKMGG